MRVSEHVYMYYCGCGLIFALILWDKTLLIKIFPYLSKIDVAIKILIHFSQEPFLVSKLFGSLRDRYTDRNGGYTRLLRIPNRQGDNAPMAVIELVDNPLPPLRPQREHASATRKKE